MLKSQTNSPAAGFLLPRQRHQSHPEPARRVQRQFCRERPINGLPPRLRCRHATAGRLGPVAKGDRSGGGGGAGIGSGGFVSAGAVDSLRRRTSPPETAGNAGCDCHQHSRSLAARQLPPSRPGRHRHQPGRHQCRADKTLNANRHKRRDKKIRPGGAVRVLLLTVRPFHNAGTPRRSESICERIRFDPALISGPRRRDNLPLKIKAPQPMFARIRTSGPIRAKKSGRCVPPST